MKHSNFLIKISPFLSIFLVFSILAVTIPFRASAQQPAYTGTFSLAGSAVVSDFQQSGIIGSTYGSNGPSLVAQGSGYPRTLLQKWFSYEISDSVNSMSAIDRSYSYLYGNFLQCSKTGIDYTYGDTLNLVYNSYDGDTGSLIYSGGCQPVGIFPTPENTQFVGAPLGPVVQTVAIPVLSLQGVARTVTVDEIPGNLAEVRETINGNATTEVYSVIFSRYGGVRSVMDGNPYGWADDNMLYENGRLYIINWATDWTGQVPQRCDEGGCSGGEMLAPAPRIVKISNSASTSDTRNFSRNDSSIADVSQPVCNYGSSDGFWRSRSWVDCTTFGLSADGRVGSAYYHDEQSSRGWFYELAGFAIMVLALYTGFGGFGEIFNVGLGGSVLDIGASGLSFAGNQVGQAVGAVTAATVSQISAPNDNLGTVENSNNIGVGAWNWSPLPPLPAPVCTSFSASPSSVAGSNSWILSWTTQNAVSASIDQGIGGVSPLTAGSKEIASPPVPTTYTLTVTGGEGTAPCTTQATISPSALTCSYSGPGASWGEGNCMSAETISYQNIPAGTGTPVSIPSDPSRSAPGYSGTITYQCNLRANGTAEFDQTSQTCGKAGQQPIITNPSCVPGAPVR